MTDDDTLTTAMRGTEAVSDLHPAYTTEVYADALRVEVTPGREVLIEPEGDELRIRRVKDV